MASIDFDALGDVQKSLERVEAGRAIMPGVPVLARLDGRGFHNFTKGLTRPFDSRLSMSMQETAKYLLDKSCADVVYTQSDEITLCWKNEAHVQVGLETKILFGGKFQKLCSILASMASVYFGSQIRGRIPEKKDELPVFDCRVWQVPNLQVAASNFLWREMDASKNSVSMAASTYFSPTELHGKSTRERKAMLETKIIFWDHFPEFFKKGTYYARRKRTRFLTAEELLMIPEKHRPVGPVERTEIAELVYPRATTINNFSEVLFNGVTPILSYEALHDQTT